MSCYSVPDEQIHVMVSYIIKNLPHNGKTFYIPPHSSIVVGDIYEPDMLNLQGIWDCLRKANNDSVANRYPDDPDMLAGFVPFVCVKDLPDPLQMYRYVENFDYQACEVDDWYTSRAKAICDGIKDLAISKLIRERSDTIEWGFRGGIEADPDFGS